VNVVNYDGSGRQRLVQESTDILFDIGLFEVRLIV